jgi:heme/copper-type cytochrome/quinol oxidase subunit 1
VAVSFLILLPTLALLGLWAVTLRKGQITMSSPLLFGGASVVMLLVGLLAGAVQAIEPIKTLVDGDGTSLYGTSWTTSVASYVFLALAIALFGGVTFWAPKILGRCLQEGAARGVALLLLAGTVLWSFPDLVSGLLGQGGDIPGPVTDNESTIEALNAASLLGGALLALAALGFIGLVVRATRSGERPGDDPWHGHTLEWATSSPPPAGNFASLPEVSSEAPLYDARHQEASA